MRLKDNGKSTVGTLNVNGTFKCFTLEDTFNEPKIYGKTRIPSGSYEVKLRNEGGMTKKYAQRYGAMHKGMLWLQDVENFKWVYIHVGNDQDDTDGCILVGYGCNTINGTISQSRDAYRDLYKQMVSAMERDEEVTVEVI